MHVQVTVIRKFHAPFDHRLAAQELLLPVGFRREPCRDAVLRVFDLFILHHPQPQSLHVGGVQRDQRCRVRLDRFFALDRELRVFQPGFQGERVARTEGSRPAGDRRIALIACGPLLPFPRITGKAIVLVALFGLPACDGDGHFAPASVVGQPRTKRLQRGEVQRVLLLQRAVLPHEPQPVEGGVDQRVDRFLVQVRSLQSLVEAQGPEFPRGTVAVFKPAQDEGFEKIEGGSIIEREAPSGLGDPRFRMCEHVQRAMSKEIEQRRAQRPRTRVTLEQFPQVADRDPLQRVVRFDRSAVR